MPPRASTLDSIRSNRSRPTRGQAHTFSVLEYLPVAPENSVGSLETTSTPTPTRTSNLFIYTPSSGRLMGAPNNSSLVCHAAGLSYRQGSMIRLGGHHSCLATRHFRLVCGSPISHMVLTHPQPMSSPTFAEPGALIACYSLGILLSSDCCLPIALEQQSLININRPKDKARTADDGLIS